MTGPLKDWLERPSASVRAGQEQHRADMQLLKFAVCVVLAAVIAACAVWFF